MWARDLAHAVGAHVPLHAAEHMYIVTQPMDGMHAGLPSLRDYDGYIYIKEDAGKMLLGGFEPVAKPWGMDGIPESFEFDVFPEDWDQFEILMNNGLHRIPSLEKAEVRQLLVGPESFTPDNRYHLGAAPGLVNYYVAAGFNSIGIASAAGAGKAVAEWVVSGEPSMDLWDVDVRRASPFMTNKRYLYDRTVESLGNMYATHWPFKQYETARGTRRSALHDTLKTAGACFGAVSGWERANWFAPAGVEPKYEYSFQRQNWFEHSAAEHRAVRETAGLFDQSSFAKFLVQGRDAERLLQRVSANDVGGAPGRVVYTQWLNIKGGIEADLTVTRWAEDAYMVVTAAASATHDLHWLKDHAAQGEAVRIADATPAWGTLSLMGPRARDILAKVADADVSNAAFPYLAARTIEVAGVRVRAQRVTYVGELGWELYVPREQMATVHKALVAAGAAHGLKLAGYHALDSLRIEKGYRHWGHDIGMEDTPIEAGLGFAVAWHKDFVGRAALEKQRNLRPGKRLVQFVLDDPEPLLVYDEPVWRDGKIVGRLTSGNYGHHIGRATGLGYVKNEAGVDAAHIEKQGFEIEVLGKRYAARASFRAPYDPKGERLRV
jgi:4-methylaminobutanoate oxidase (formaldehyde-forming)